MKLTFFGHSAFAIEAGGTRILIDPFFTGNPAFPQGLDPMDAAGNAQHIVLTHGHGDHVGDTVAIAQKTGAIVTANYDLAMWLHARGVDNINPTNTGGTVDLGAFKVTYVQAHHSSAHLSEDGVSHGLGHSNGVVIEIAGEKTLYHAGDTDIFSDMALIEEFHAPKIGILPVGDRFTMGAKKAAVAARRYFNFETVIPCHFGSFPIVDPSADAFVEAMGDAAGMVRVMQPGETVTL
ncbi:MAG: metal-dependent hydrolase [Hyphomicrobiaceae bacterium]|nr:metal-dependent hydrolase [Hyphomicrobiaceae bacterium]